MVGKAREWVFNGLVLAGIGALGIIFALSPAKMENQEWVGVGLWAAALAAMVALPQGGTEARGVLACGLLLFALLKSLNGEQLEEWWIRNPSDPQSPLDWAAFWQKTQPASWVALYLFGIGLVRCLTSGRRPASPLYGMALGGLLLLLVAILTPWQIGTVHPQEMAASFPYALGAIWLLAHGTLPLWGLAGVFEEPSWARWTGAVALALWLAKALFLVATR